ncbi:ribosomal protein S11, partial [Paenarthrobacter ilicis]
SGAYITDSSGTATIPPGDIIVGAAAGSLSASTSGATTTTQLPVRTTGALQLGSGAPNIPAVNNSGFVHIATANGGAVAIKANGEIWRSTANARQWTKIGDGASTDPNQAGFLNYGDGTEADGVWIKSGALQFGTGAATISAADNNGFVGVTASNGGATAVKANGEVWRTNAITREWIKIGDGASTGPSQSGSLNYGDSTGADGVWIKNGALQFGTGAANIPAANNNDFVRVTAINAGAVAVKANGEVWRTRTNAREWIKIGDGASTGPSQNGFLIYGNRTGADGVWIKNGALQFGTEAANISAFDNKDFVRVAASGGGGVAIKANGEVWRTRQNAPEWTIIGTLGLTEPGQSGFLNYGGATGPDGLWIKTSLSCPLPS